MKKTIDYKELENFWNGKVIIREIKKYTDNRGMVGEIFRTDSDINFDSKMCYISETNSFILRGPHEHKEQKDVFITWGDDNRMIYQLYNKELNEMKFFITEPNKIYSVTVEPGIIHSYRNISINSIKTLNFPDKLYKGNDKLEEVDEIRHEDTIKPTKNIWVFGANGRLGKSLVKQLFNNMGYHEYNVIPVMEKFENNKVGMDNLLKILNFVIENRTENDIIINCISKTKVYQDNLDFTFTNYLLPKYITEFCIKNKIYFLHFSTDYVYQSGIFSNYTKSKKLYENWLMDLIEEDTMLGYDLTDTKKYIKIIRLANLFSLENTDNINLLNKLYENIKKGTIKIQENFQVMPTSVEKVSEFITTKYLNNIDIFNQIINLSGIAYKIDELIKNNFKNIKYEIEYYENEKVKNNTMLFLNTDNYYELNCDVDISKKIDIITNSSL